MDQSPCDIAVESTSGMWQTSEYKHRLKSGVEVMTAHRIELIKPLEDRRLLVRFVDSVEKTYDCGQLLHLEMFQVLRNEEFLKSVRVDARGYGVSWNDEVDLSECELWISGKEPALTD